MKKTIAIMLCSAMVLSTVACSSDKEGDSGANAEESSNSTSVAGNHEETDELKEAISEDVDEIVDGLYTKYDKLLEEANDYEAFMSNIDDVEEFYSLVIEETKELCIRMREYSVEYAEIILSSGSSTDDMYDNLEGIYEDIYDGALEDIYDDIYDELLEDMYDAFYNGIVDEAYDTIDYSEWSSARSDEYSRWSNCRSDVYSTWSNCRSDVYSFRSSLASALYKDDVDQAYDEVDNFKEDIDDIRNGIDSDEEKTEEFADEDDTSVEEAETSVEFDESNISTEESEILEESDISSEETETSIEDTTISEIENESTSEDVSESDTSSEASEELVDGMRPAFKEAMDSYEKFYDEYCEFMEEYMNNPSDLSLLSKYAEMIETEAEMCEKLDEWDEDEMNTAELKYYIEVTARVTQKLVEIGQ